MSVGSIGDVAVEYRLCDDVVRDWYTGVRPKGFELCLLVQQGPAKLLFFVESSFLICENTCGDKVGQGLFLHRDTSMSSYRLRYTDLAGRPQRKGS